MYFKLYDCHLAGARAEFDNTLSVLPTYHFIHLIRSKVPLQRPYVFCTQEYVT